MEPDPENSDGVRLTAYERRLWVEVDRILYQNYVHTNTIEGFWSLFKRGIMGSHHKISAKYLPPYVAELQFRYNNRKDPAIFETALRGC